MKMRDDNPLRVVQITDTHLKSQAGSRLWGVDVDANLTAVLQRLKTRHWPVQFILATGDLVHDEGAQAYERLYAFLEPLGVPVYCLPGNHDAPEELEQALTNPVRRQRHINAGHWQFILLDSTVHGSDAGHLLDSELMFLESTLRVHPRQHAIICLHHQPLPIGCSWLDTMVVDNGEKLLAIAGRHPQVRAIVYGHIHQEFAARHGAVELLGAPSTCVQFKPDAPTAEADPVPPGYRWFELYPDGRLLTGIERTKGII